MAFLFSLALLPAAVILDWLLGDPSNRFHPVCLIGYLARRTEPLMRRLLPRHLLVGGMLATLICLISMSLIIFIPYTVIILLTLPTWTMGIVSLLVLYIFIAPKGLSLHAKKVMEDLDNQDITQARHDVSMIVGRNTQNLDEYAIARASIESVSENLTDGVISSLFWATAGLLLGGLTGAGLAVVIHRTCNILDALWGKRNEQYRHFGTCAARCDDALNFLPARLSFIFIAIASLFLYPSRLVTTLRIGWKYRYAHASPNSAWSEAAFAGALDLTLSGPVQYKLLVADYPWIGEGRLKATPKDIHNAIRLMWMTTWISTLILTFIIFILS